MGADACQVRVALGTGSFMVMFVMTWVSLTFINRDGMNDIINLYHALIAVPFGMLVRAEPDWAPPTSAYVRLTCVDGLTTVQGALVGSRFALRVNDTVLYVVIMLVSFLLFTLAELYNNVTLDP